MIGPVFFNNYANETLYKQFISCIHKNNYAVTPFTVLIMRAATL